jgi:hypothetical protein
LFKLLRGERRFALVGDFDALRTPYYISISSWCTDKNGLAAGWFAVWVPVIFLFIRPKMLILGG